jgi:phage-related protein
VDWQVVYYRDSKGNEPVQDFIRAQSPAARSRIVHVIDLLQTYALTLRPLYVKKITKSGLWELRIHHSPEYYRIFYFTFTERRFVLLHAFLKKTDKTPRTEINIALKRMEEVKFGPV